MKVNQGKYGITLIALVVTIVILIILAVISINSVFGEDGLIASAERGSIEHTHAMVWEAMEMEYSNYWIDKVMLGGNLITYLQGEDKGIIGQELKGAGYVINVEKLLGNRMSLGNGTDGINDVYKLEPLQTEENIKLADEIAISESIYQVKYYGPSGDKILGILGDNISSLVESDNPNLEITKKPVSTPKNEKYYTIGESIKYVITVTNTGDVPIKDIHIVDELTSGSGTYKPGDGHLVLSEENSGKVKAGEEYWIIDSLEVEESETITYTYTVQGKDVEEGKIIVNVITELTGVPQPTVPKGHIVPPVELPVAIEKVNVSVNKIWTIDGMVSEAPSGATIVVGLIINNQLSQQTLTLSSENNWQGEFKDLPMYDESGAKIVYEVKEVTGYGEWQSTVNRNGENDFTITNSNTTPKEPEEDRTFIIRKVTDKGNLLTGAIIAIYKDKEGKELYETIDLTENAEYDHSSNIPPVGKYYISEIRIPDGYNGIYMEEFEITGKQHEEWNIVNYDGVELPST